MKAKAAVVTKKLAGAQTGINVLISRGELDGTLLHLMVTFVSYVIFDICDI